MKTAKFSLIISLALVMGTGCSTKKDMDKTVDDFLASLHQEDYSAFEKMAYPGVSEKMPEKTFQRISSALTKLGKFKDRTMQGVSVKSGAPDKGSYELEYENGEVTLQIEVMDGKLVSFLFTGEDMEAAFKKVQAERYKNFEVLDFTFLDATTKNPNPSGNVYAPETTVAFRLQVAGLKKKENAMHLHVALVLREPDGKIESKEPNLVDQRIPVEASDPPVAIVNGSFSLGKRTGSLQVELTIQDKADGRELTYSQGIVIR